MKIDGTTALVTGANRGIGRAIAEALAQRGARVLLGMRQPDSDLLAELAKTKRQGSFEIFPMDMSGRETIDDAIDRIGKMGADIDILVNNAGQLTGGLLEEQDIDEIYSMFQVNLVGLTHLTARLIPGMVSRGRGRIVMNSSVSGVMHFPCASTYAAAKTGVVALTECLEAELKGTGVSTLLLLTPGVKTRMFDDIPNKYGKNMNLGFLSTSIEANDWAEQVVDAIVDDIPVLEPKGSTRIGLTLARHFPGVFSRLAQSQFSRSRSAPTGG